MNLRQLSLILIIFFVAGCSTLPKTERIKSADAAHSYVLKGSGYSTVVLESGLGNGKESWKPVYNAISEFSRVVAYDLAGYGRSRSKNLSRDGATIVQELRSMLRELELVPPYVLVGHSLGGTYMELYARSYPDEVAGLVLVDSRHTDFSRQCKLAGIRICAPPLLLAAMMPAGPRAEINGMDKTIVDIKQAGEFPEVPLVVLSSGSNFLMGDKFQSVWLETQKSLSTLSDGSVHTVCRECGHFIQKDAPDLVVDAVRQVVNQIRDR